MYKLINSIDEIPKTKITKENLKYTLRTGQSKTKKDVLRKRNITEYRDGMLTPIGDIKYSVWKSAVYLVVDKRQEQRLFKALKEYFQNSPSPAFRKDYEEWALIAYMSDLYNNPEWVGYEEFHQKYYSEVTI